MKEQISLEQWNDLTLDQKAKITTIDALGNSKTGMPTLAQLISTLMNGSVEAKTMLLRAMQSLFAPQLQVHKLTGKPVGVKCNAESVEPVDLLFKIIKEKV